MTKCKICLENFDESEHSAIPCINGECTFDICRYCLLIILQSKKRYKFLECKYDWDKEYLSLFFSESLINTVIENDYNCTVCAESYDDNEHSLIPCDTCKYEACKECIYVYIINKQKSKCMHCNSIWNKEFLLLFFSELCCDILIGDTRNQIPPRTTSINPVTRTEVRNIPRRRRRIITRNSRGENITPRLVV